MEKYTVENFKRSFLPPLGIIAAVSAASPAVGQITVAERDFAPGSFSISVVLGGRGGPASHSVVGSGNPGSALSITHFIPGGPPSDNFCANWAWTFVVLKQINPVDLGGIGRIDFAMDSAMISSQPEPMPQSQRPLIVQGGRLYITSLPPGVTPVSSSWSTMIMEGLVASDFVEVINMAPCDFVSLTSHPDFSPTAMPIQLGFARGNSSSVGGSPNSASIEYGADNWSMTIYPCTTCCVADYNADGTVDFFDYLDFVAAFSSGAPAADFNADTVIDFFDYLDFVAAFSTGCP